MIQPLNNNNALIPSPTPADRERDQIRRACDEFEGVFIGTLLKEGLKPMFNESADAPPGQEAAMHLAIEYTAREMGQQGAIGMADVLYKDLADLL